MFFVVDFGPMFIEPSFFCVYHQSSILLNVGTFIWVDYFALASGFRACGPLRCLRCIRVLFIVDTPLMYACTSSVFLDVSVGAEQSKPNMSPAVAVFLAVAPFAHVAFSAPSRHKHAEPVLRVALPLPRKPAMHACTHVCGCWPARARMQRVAVDDS